MGASYSSSQVASSIPLSNVSSTEDTTNELKESTETSQESTVNKEIFVLFENDGAVCYSNKFNTLFEKAVTIKNKIIYNLITRHGNTFSVTTKENTDNKSFSNVTILTRETNCLNSRDNIYQTLSIISLTHLDDIENIEDEIVNRTESSDNEEKNDESVEPSNPEKELENTDENLYNSENEDNEDNHHFNEHDEHDEHDENEENNETNENNTEETSTKTTKVE